YAESELLLADAAQRFDIGGDAKTHYDAGVKSAITYLKQYDAAATITDAAAQAYVNAHPYNSATGLEQINTQYWLLTNSMLDFYESWSNWRRTGFPALTPVNFPSNATGGTIPRRFPYPSGEAATNPDNYGPAHGSVTGGDFLTGRVWWDKQ
ncbi:MAG: SusD/RagB family nutrient-binding outer membrane lipoprotein, partial [Sphingobacteriaceae bacterium]